MERITRYVRDMSADERRVLEQILGRQLRENQQLVIDVETPGEPARSGQAPGPPGKLPDWCNVFEGLTGEQLAEVEQIILQRSNLTRPSP